MWGSYEAGAIPPRYTGYPRGLRSLRPGFESQHGRLAGHRGDGGRASGRSGAAGAAGTAAGTLLHAGKRPGRGDPVSSTRSAPSRGESPRKVLPPHPGASEPRPRRTASPREPIRPRPPREGQLLRGGDPARSDGGRVAPPPPAPGTGSHRGGTEVSSRWTRGRATPSLRSREDRIRPPGMGGSPPSASLRGKGDRRWTGPLPAPCRPTFSGRSPSVGGDSRSGPSVSLSYPITVMTGTARKEGSIRPRSPMP